MRRQRISEIMGNIDETYIEEATSYTYMEKTTLRARWVKWGAIAACFVIVVSVIFLLAHNPSTGKYKIIYQNGSCYVQFSKEFKNISGSQGVGNQEVIPYVWSESLTDMKEKFLHNQLADDELLWLSRFERDDNGLVKIPDMNRLYCPVFSEELRMDAVVLQSGHYAVHFYHGEKQINWIYYYDEATYGEAYNFARNQYINSILTHTINEDRNADVYEYTDSSGRVRKRIVYTITTETATFLVDEYYEEIDASLPATVKLYGSSEFGNFVVDFLWKYGRPSVELISQFGIQPFNE